MSRQTLPTKDGGKVIDYLDEDTEIPTQRFCLMSFLSPEKVIEQKAEFYNKKFLEWLDYDWKVKGLEKLMDFLSKKYTLKVEDLFKDLEAFQKVHNEDVKKTDIHEQYEVFLLKNEKEIQKSFNEKVEFQTNVRGVKVRRVFESYEEAKVAAGVFQRKYPNDNLLIGRIGCWLPWDPSEYLVGEVNYGEKELNELMRRYKENEVNKDIFFEEDKRTKIKAQQEENERRRIENAKKDAGVTDASDLMQSLTMPSHPTEGALREL